MEKQRLGNSDLEITKIGFGAWAIGGSGWEYGWGAQDDADSVAAIHRALELGINWIDTAAVYGLGHSEEVVAEALSSWSGDRPYVFTKCGLVNNATNRIDKVLRADSIKQECENSLRRLRTDTIDLYQIHWPLEDLRQVEEGWQAMADLQREGKVRWIGVSNFNAEQLRACEAIAKVTSLQPPYSLLRRAIEAETLPFCREHEIGVIVYSPMTSGLLTGSMTKERANSLPKDDWRSKNAEFKEPKLSKNLAFVEKLRKIGSRHGHGPGEIAIAWTLRNPAVTAAIVGARNPKQVEGIVGGAAVRLSDDEWQEIEAAIPVS